MLISSITSQNGTLITPLFLFHRELGLVCTNTHGFVEQTPTNGFNSFIQSAVDARRQRDEIPISSVFAETINLLAISSNGYQIMDRSPHSVKKKSQTMKKSMLLKNVNWPVGSLTFQSRN